MACLRCGDCCKKFRITVKIGEAVRKQKQAGQEWTAIQFSPRPLFEKFLEAMGVRTGNIIVRIPLDKVDPSCDHLTLTFNRRCPHLTDDNLCDIYDHKPEFCTKFMCTAAQMNASDVLSPDEVRSITGDPDERDLS